MRYFEASTDIAVPPQSVWNALIDVGSWSRWDSGAASVVIRSEAAQGRDFPVKVVELESPSRLVLAGGMPLGLFRSDDVRELVESRV